MRKVIAFLMTVTVCLSLMIMPAMAAEDYPEVGFDFEAFEAQERIDGTPKVARWKYTATTSQGIGVKDKIATANISVTGYKGTATRIVAYMYIQQLSGGNWITLDSHRYEFNSWHGSKEITYSPCPHGYTYRLKASYYVYSGSQYEYISATKCELRIQLG